MKSHQDSLGFLITDLSRLMRRNFAQRLGSVSLTLAQARALIHLSLQEGLRQVELAGLLEIQPITLARLVDQLSQAGLVERRPDPGDRRAYRLYLTPAAEPHLATIDKVVASIRADAMRGIDKSQAAAVLSALSKMRDNLALNHEIDSGEDS